MTNGAVGTAGTGAAIATGVLFSAPGKVYVSYQGVLHLFKTPALLANYGYGGSAAVPVPGVADLTVVPS